jgi:hypothetical protein
VTRDFRGFGVQCVGGLRHGSWLQCAASRGAKVREATALDNSLSPLRPRPLFEGSTGLARAGEAHDECSIERECCECAEWLSRRGVTARAGGAYRVRVLSRHTARPTAQRGPALAATTSLKSDRLMVMRDSIVDRETATHIDTINYSPIHFMYLRLGFMYFKLGGGWEAGSPDRPAPQLGGGCRIHVHTTCDAGTSTVATRQTCFRAASTYARDCPRAFRINAKAVP